MSDNEAKWNRELEELYYFKTKLSKIKEVFKNARLSHQKCSKDNESIK